MLGLPMVSYESGIGMSMLMLILSWFFMVLGALTIVEICYNYPDGTNFKLIANDCLGKIGQAITWCAYILLVYSLLSAYMMGGASIISSLLALEHVNIPNWLALAVFLAILTPFVYCGTKSVDRLNRILLSSKLLFLIIVVSFILGSGNVSYNKIFDSKGLAIALPVLATSYTFHYIIPTIKSYLDIPKKQLYKVVIIASLIPLTIYILWEIAIMGGFPGNGTNSFADVAAHGNNVGVFLVELSHYVHNNFFSIILSIFYNIAITTSFLGTAISLLHFNENTYNLKDNKFISYLLTFMAPFLVVALFPNIFLQLLSYAGVFVAVLFLIIPGVMYLKKFYNNPEQRQSVFMVASILLILTGITILSCKAMSLESSIAHLL